MLKIRLRRSGKKNKPQYRIVVAEHTAPIQGKFIDLLGSYNPHTKALTVKKEELLKWVNQGAEPSNRVAKLMQQSKISHPNVKVVLAAKKASKQEEKPKSAEASASKAEIPADSNSESNESPKNEEKSEDSTENEDKSNNIQPESQS